VECKFRKEEGEEIEKAVVRFQVSGKGVHLTCVILDERY
jgi:hypothetical protein